MSINDFDNFLEIEYAVSKNKTEYFTENFVNLQLKATDDLLEHIKTSEILKEKGVDVFAFSFDVFGLELKNQGSVTSTLFKDVCLDSDLYSYMKQEIADDSVEMKDLDISSVVFNKTINGNRSSAAILSYNNKIKHFNFSSYALERNYLDQIKIFLELKNKIDLLLKSGFHASKDAESFLIVNGIYNHDWSHPNAPYPFGRPKIHRNFVIYKGSDDLSKPFDHFCYAIKNMYP